MGTGTVDRLFRSYLPGLCAEQTRLTTGRPTPTAKGAATAGKRQRSAVVLVASLAGCEAGLAGRASESACVIMRKGLPSRGRSMVE